MKNKILLIITLLLIVCNNNALSQCIILDLKLNECVSCRNNLSVLEGLTDEVPVFAIFRESQRVDSADLDYKFSLQAYKVKYLFNTSVYKKIHKEVTFSTWYLLDQNGNVVMEGNLKKIDDAEKLDSIRSVIALLPPYNHCHFNFTKTKIFILNYDLGKIQIISKDNLKSVITITTKDFDYKYLLANLHGNDSLAFAQRGTLINTHGKGYKPEFTWFDINTSGECYVMLEYMQPFIKKDSFVYETHSCLVKYDTLGKIERVWPEDFESANKWDNSIGQFAFKNDNSFIAVTHDPKNWFNQLLKKDPNKKIEFLTDYTFNATGGIVKPTKQYPMDLPAIYKKKYFDNYIDPALCSYPYITFRYANDVYNLSTLKSSPIIDPSTYNAHVNFTNKELGNERFTILAAKLRLNKDELLIVYNLGDSTYIKGFDKGLKITRYASIGNILNGHTINFCFIDPYSEKIYFTFNEEVNTICLPLSFFNF